MYHLTIIDSNINLYTRFNADAGDLLNNITRSMQINQPLVNTHLKLVPSVGTLTRRSLTGSNPELLGGKTDGSRNVKLLVGGTLLQVGAYLLEVLDVTRSQGDADAVHLGTGIFEASFFLSGGDVGGHFDVE